MAKHDPLNTLLDYVDDVLGDYNPIQFLEEGIHARAMEADPFIAHPHDRFQVDAPIEVKMEDGHKIATHMMSQIHNLQMFETQDDNLRGSIMNALSYEPEKVFEVVDSDTGYPAMVARESSNCCERNCMGSKCRPFRFTLFARSSPTVLLPALQLDKGYSFTCVNKMMRVTSHNGKSTMGYIEPKTHCCRIQFNGYDRNRNQIFQIKGNKFQLSSVIGKLPLPGLKRVVFTATDNHGRNMGLIANEWGGFCRELLGDADDYTIKFDSSHTKPEDKLIFLATAFYLDMRYFTSCCSFSVRDCLIKRYTPAPVVKTMKYAPIALQGAKAGKDAKKK